MAAAATNRGKVVEKAPPPKRGKLDEVKNRGKNCSADL